MKIDSKRNTDASRGNSMFRGGNTMDKGQESDHKLSVMVVYKTRTRARRHVWYSSGANDNTEIYSLPNTQLESMYRSSTKPRIDATSRSYKKDMDRTPDLNIHKNR